MFEGQAPPEDSASPSLEVLFVSERRALCRLAHLLTGSASLGEEIVQDAFLALHRNWADVVEPARYLRRTVINRARSEQRRQIFRRWHGPASSPSVVVPDEYDETWQLIRRLPAEQRAVLVLRFYEDRTLGEIAAELQRPLGTIKSLLHRALARLRREIDG